MTVIDVWVIRGKLVKDKPCIAEFVKKTFSCKGIANWVPSQSVTNKAVYATASVAYRWAGAVMPFKYIFSKNFSNMTDEPTNGWMDRQ